MKQLSIVTLDDYGFNSDLIERYNEPNRYFHNWSHINYMLKTARKTTGLTDQLILSILFHDIIYNPTEKNNEIKSAELFLELAKQSTSEILLSKGQEWLDEIYEAILSTEKHNPTNKLSEDLIYLDLYQVRNGSLESFIEGEEGIFKEYQFVDYTTYVNKRCEVLESLGTKQFMIDYVKHRKPKIGIYPGSFNPFHKGHYDILLKAEQVFDKVIIARGLNPNKYSDSLNPLPVSIQNRELVSFKGLLSTYVKSLPYDVTVIKGLRNQEDFKFEQLQYRYLSDFYPEIKVINFFGDIKYEHVSSSSIKTLDEEYQQKYLIK